MPEETTDTTQAADAAVTDAPTEPVSEPGAGADETLPGAAPTSTGPEGDSALTWRQQQAADRSGMTEEDVSALVDAWGLERAQAFLDQRAEQHDALSKQASQFQPGGGAPPGKGTGDAGAPDLSEEEFSMPPELFDQTWEQPEAVAKFMQPVVSEVNRLRGLVRDLHGRLQETSDRTTAMTADTFFASLGPEYRDLFGAGPTDVTSSAAEQQARRRVMQSADRIAKGFAASGTPIHPREALERALSMEEGERIGTIARNRAAEREKRRAGQRAAAPGGRRQRKPESREERKSAFVTGAQRIKAGRPYER